MREGGNGRDPNGCARAPLRRWRERGEREGREGEEGGERVRERGRESTRAREREGERETPVQSKAWARPGPLRRRLLRRSSGPHGVRPRPLGHDSDRLVFQGDFAVITDDNLPSRAGSDGRGTSSTELARNVKLKFCPPPTSHPQRPPVLPPPRPALRCQFVSIKGLGFASI
jgi:hypothetical protein